MNSRRRVNSTVILLAARWHKAKQILDRTVRTGGEMFQAATQSEGMMWMKSITALILLAAFQAGPLAEPGRQSAGAAGTKAEGEAPERAPWSVTYHDGSGNGFRFWKDVEGLGARFEYTPVRPENSATGLYSGGEPKSGQLGGRRARELWRWVRRLEADASLHTDSRMKGTGAFSLTEPRGDTREFIIKGSTPLSEFNKFLAPFRGGRQGLQHRA